MDPRSWPWRMKTSLKGLTEKRVVDASESALASANSKKGNNVKKSPESYALIVTSLEHHVVTLKDEIKIWREEVQDLTQKLCEAQLEMTAKDSLVNQHSKVAEEAVSGWEKAKVKYVALKSQLESVTLAKVSAENRAFILDSALTECMMQVTLVKDESEKLLHEVILTKTKEWDMIKHDLEGQIAELNDRLLKSTAENAALSSSLQEYSDTLMIINERKSAFELENEVMHGKIEDYEKEMKRVKYEMNVLTKEIEIRNEEKIMSVKSAEAANKLHLEGVKKLVKLEAECQRLRGLVRTKLPGPAAMAQMKRESAYLDRPKSKRPPPVMKNNKTMQTSSGIPSRKESELLKTRLLMAEEKTKMLKEALTAQMDGQIGIQESRKSTEGSLISRDGSVASISDDGLDEDGSSVGSWIESISNFSHLSRNTTTSLELMDDFLEVERQLAFSSLDLKNKQEDEVAGAEAKPTQVQERQPKSFHYFASAEALGKIQQGFTSTPFSPPK